MFFCKTFAGKRVQEVQKDDTWYFGGGDLNIQRDLQTGHNYIWSPSRQLRHMLARRSMLGAERYG